MRACLRGSRGTPPRPDELKSRLARVPDEAADVRRDALKVQALRAPLAEVEIGLAFTPQQLVESYALPEPCIASPLLVKP